MSTAIVYSTKHGATSRLAERIAAALGPGARTFDLAAGTPDLTEFDTVVLGTPIYYGKPRKELAAFARQAGLTAGGALADRRLGLFVSGMVTEPATRNQELADAFGSELSERAVATAFLPGGFDFVKLNALERFVIKRVGSVTDSVDATDEAAIAKFVDRLQG